MIGLPLVGVALVGHAALWLRVVNHAHSVRLPHHFVRWVTRTAVTCFVVIPLAILLFNPTGLWRTVMTGDARGHSWPIQVYGALCLLAGIVAMGGWCWRRLASKPRVLQFDRCRRINLVEHLGERPIGPGPKRYMTRLPGNEIFRLDVSEKSIAVPHLDESLDGLTIAHLSDLHFVGTISKPFYDMVVDLVNEMQVDLVAITGDLVDDSQCIDWLGDSLRRIDARHGSYFVLGNHDARVDFQRLRQTLVTQGLVDLGGRSRRIAVGGGQILLAGNEAPWFGAAPTLQPCPPSNGARTLRLGLAHSPDQFAWARRNHIDLLMAGHTHGGQIQMPVVGPLWAPSHFGVKYASGTFHKSPTTMHVSRGLSGLTPLRFNCPPEMTKLVLRAV